MDYQEFERQYIRSLDETLSTTEWQQLATSIRDDGECQKISAAHDRVRGEIKRSQPTSFGSDFGSTVLKLIQQGITSFDNEIAFLFKKVHLLTAGVIICLLIVNLIYADNLSIQSVLVPSATPADTTVSDELVVDISKLMDPNNE